MAALILGISGSPVVENNTDRAVREILERTGMEYEFVKLSNLHLEPCRACLKCSEDNSCTIYDNGRVLAQRFAAARGFVIGGYSSYGSLDSRTKMFMERMFCLSHVRSKNRGKAGVCVITSEAGGDETDMLQRQFGTWMKAEQMVNLGSLIVPGDTACIRCGHSNQCASLELGEQLRRAPATMSLQDMHLEPTIMTSAADLAIKLREAVEAGLTIA